MSTIGLVLEVNCNIQSKLDITIDSVFMQSISFDKIYIYAKNDILKSLQSNIRFNEFLDHADNVNDNLEILINSLNTDYFYFLRISDSIEDNFVIDMKKYIKKYNNPDLIIFGRIHNYLLNGKTKYSTAWNWFKYDTLLCKCNFSSSIFQIIREIEGLMLYNSSNRLYKVNNFKNYLKDNINDFSCNQHLFKMHSLASNDTILTLKNSYFHKYYEEVLTEEEYFQRINSFYEELLFLINTWDMFIERFDEIYNITAYYCVISFERMLDVCDLKKSDKIIMLINDFINTEYFERIYIFCSGLVTKELIKCLKNIIVKSLSKDNTSTIKKSDYSILISNLKEEGSSLLFQILHNEEKMYDEGITVSNISNSLIINRFIKSNIYGYFNLDIESERFDELISKVVQFKLAFKDCILIVAAQTVIHLLVGDIGEANLDIEEAENNIINIKLFYLTCSILCKKTGLTDMCIEFKDAMLEVD